MKTQAYPSLQAILAVLCAGAIGDGAFAQARLIINNNAWVRIDNGAWVVIENPNPTGIQTMGTGGNIWSEGEFNRIRWQIRNGVGSYTVPFTTPNGVKMPLTYTVTTAGSNEATASICFSTYNYLPSGVPPGSQWNNFLYRPTDVTHMNSYNAPSVPNSDNVVDRFWIIDPGVAGYAYGTRPAISLDFVYDPSAALGEVRPGNAITPVSPVGAQRFNNNANIWGDYLPAGAFSLAGPVNTVTGATADPANFFRSWTLANILEPLPVELVSFTGQCDRNTVLLQWTTANETHSSHFIVERSGDGQVFEPIGTVQAMGSVVGVTNYSFTDGHPLSFGYYRLLQVDMDGSSTSVPAIAVACGSQGQGGIITTWDDGDGLHVLVQSASEQPTHVRLFDAGGKLVWENATVVLNEGLTTVRIPRSGLADGVYVVRFDGAGEPMARRVALF